MEIKNGSKALRLDKDGATSVVVDKRENLVATISWMIDAVHGDELDAAIEPAAKRSQVGDLAKILQTPALKN